jgi:dTDP-4-amino-4,6-dideoxygalactose transaminase
LWLVEDAAHALGARVGESTVGACAMSDATTFSFHPVKHITTAEGGAVSTRRPELKQKLDRLREHGLERRPAPGSNGLWGYEQQDLGWNYRLSDLNAALGSSQLDKAPAWLARRCQVAARYRAAFAGLAEHPLRCLPEPGDRHSAHHLFPVHIEFEKLGLARGEVMAALRARGIGTQVHYIPVCDQPYYSARGQSECPRARRFYATELSLPMYSALTDTDVDRVCAALREIIQQPMAAAV